MFHQWSYDHVLCIIYLNHFEVWHDTRFHFTLDYPKQESWPIPKRRTPAGKDCCLLSPKLKARPALPCSVFLQTSTRDGQEGATWWYPCFYPLFNCLLFENRPKRLKSSMCSTIHSKSSSGTHIGAAVSSRSRRGITLYGMRLSKQSSLKAF